MSSARKKVILRRFGPGPLRGYLEPTGFVHLGEHGPVLQFLDLSGRTQDVSLAEVKMVSFVREFYLTDEVNPERLPRKNFLARPRTEGLWVRLTFRDEDQMEGLAPLDLAMMDGLVEDRGLQLVPPDIRGNTQRVFVPRSALTSFQVVAVVTTPARRKALEGLKESGTREEQQPGLFSAEQDRFLPQ